ncbi:MAG TPA: hypothetical protein VGZ22_03475 [Isosphaeraceae bacterium]|jgi:hypothetical protein|nr:hypothetical protein [Isosphaeraceae bacterium]
MSLTEWLPKLQGLPRAEKLRLIQFLVVDLAREEGVSLVDMAAPFPVWSPFDAYDAAGVMLRALDEQGANK